MRKYVSEACLLCCCIVLLRCVEVQEPGPET